MTHEQRAAALIDGLEPEYSGGDYLVITRAELEDKIARGMAEASNAELERKRAVEAELRWLEKVMGRFPEYLDSAWIRNFLEAKGKWSYQTFGPGARSKGVIAHLRKELEELERDPMDLMEWVDVFMLATDGFWRAYVEKHGGFADGEPIGRHIVRAAHEFISLILEKHIINTERQWPASTSQDEPVEHVR